MRDGIVGGTTTRLSTIRGLSRVEKSKREGDKMRHLSAPFTHALGRLAHRASEPSPRVLNGPTTYLDIAPCAYLIGNRPRHRRHEVSGMPRRRRFDQRQETRLVGDRIVPNASWDDCE